MNVYRNSTYISTIFSARLHNLKEIILKYELTALKYYFYYINSNELHDKDQINYRLIDIK